MKKIITNALLATTILLSIHGSVHAQQKPQTAAAGKSAQAAVSGKATQSAKVPAAVAEKNGQVATAGKASQPITFPKPAATSPSTQPVTPANSKSPVKRPILNHIALSVKDLAKSTAFYHQIVQLDTIPEPFHDGRHTWFSIAEHSHLHLIQYDNGIIVPAKGSHLCFSVTSIDDFMKRLESSNIPWSNWQGEAKAVTLRVDGVKQIYLQDPDGYWIEINDDKY